jgi:hypothetical protein
MIDLDQPVGRLVGVVLAAGLGYKLATVLMDTMAGTPTTESEDLDSNATKLENGIITIDPDEMCVFNLVALPIAMNELETASDDLPVVTVFANNSYWLLMGDRSLEEFSRRRQNMYDTMSMAWRRNLRELGAQVRLGQRWMLNKTATFLPSGYNGNGKPMQVLMNMAPLAIEGMPRPHVLAEFNCEPPVSESTVEPDGSIKPDGLAMADTLLDGLSGAKLIGPTDCTPPSSLTGGGSSIHDSKEQCSLPTLGMLRVLDNLNTHVALFGYDSASGLLSVEYTNAAMVKLLGDESEAALNQRMTARFAPKTAAQKEQIRRFAARHLHDGRAVERARQTWNRTDGSSVQMIVTCRPVTIDGGTAGPRNCIMVQTSAMLPVRKFAMDSIDNWNNRGLEDSFANELRRVAVESSPETMLFGTQGEVLYVNPAAREWFQGVVGDKPEAEWRMKDMFASRATYVRMSTTCLTKRRAMEMSLPMPNNPDHTFIIKATYALDVQTGNDSILLTFVSSGYTEKLQKAFAQLVTTI